jgi:dTDP-4-dehydrorhamnose reductase
LTARLLVFGRSGQVARALADAASPFEHVLAGRERLDLAAPDPDIAGLIAETRPAAVINAAAFTAVDAAETETAAALRLNRDAPAQMAEACAAADIPFVHFSTDYVFDGEKGAPYVETDPHAPISAYGASKAAGEAALEAVAARGARLAVIRTSWVFAPNTGGFMGAMLGLRERESVRVVHDQLGSPTPANACAAAALVLAEALLDRDPGAESVFHAAGRDGVSRAELAEALFAQLPRGPHVIHVDSSEFPTPARRPRDTRLSSAKLEDAFGWRAPPLGDAIADYLARARTSGVLA